MKLIALKDFRNVPLLEIKLDKPQHDLHIHKGATFDIGNGKTLKECSARDKELIAQLVYAGAAGDGSDTATVKAVQEELKAEQKSAEASRALQQSADHTTIVTHLVNLLKQAGFQPPAAKPT